MTDWMATYRQHVLPLMTEFTAQFMLTFWGSMSIPPYGDGNKNESRHENGEKCCSSPDADYSLHGFMPAFQAGVGVWIILVVFVRISPAHFNPAVSIGFVLAGQLRPIMFIPYVAAQCFGSVAAAAAAKALLGTNPAIIAIPNHVPAGRVFFTEVIITGLLLFSVLPMVVDEHYDQHTGLMAVGLTVFKGLLASKWIGTACISPSRAFGPAVVVGGVAWNRHWLLWLADLSGGVLGSAYYMTFFAPTNKSWLEKLTTKRKDRKCSEEQEMESMVNKNKSEEAAL